MSKFLRRSLMIFIIKGFRTIVFIFIVISTTFRPICLPGFFGCFLSIFQRQSFIIKGFRTIVLSLRVFGLLFSSLLLFPQRFGWYVLQLSSGVFCLYFRDKAWWFLSFRVFRLLFSSLLLFPQRFGRYVLRPSSGVCCLNFWDEAWFLSLRVFGLLASSL